QLRLALCRRLRRWRAAEPARGRVEPRCRDRARLLAGRAPCTAQSELVHPVEAPERLFVDDPCEAELRVDRRIELLAERAVVVRAHCSGREQSVLPADLLMHVHAERGVRDERFGAGPDRATTLRSGLYGPEILA